MAWTGTPVVKSLGKNVVRITGVPLTGGSSGTIGPSASLPEITLPSTFPTASNSATLTMSDLVMVSFQRGDVGGGAEATHLHVDMTDTPFLITFSNDLVNPSGPLDIRLIFFHSFIR